MFSTVQSIAPSQLAVNTLEGASFKDLDLKKEQAGAELRDLNSGLDNSNDKTLNENVRSTSNKSEANTLNKNTEKKNPIDFSGISEKIQNLIGEKNLNIEFKMDKDTKRMIMRIVNSETKEVVKQFPPEVSLKIARIVANQLESGHVANATV